MSCGETLSLPGGRIKGLLELDFKTLRLGPRNWHISVLI